MDLSQSVGQFAEDLFKLVLEASSDKNVLISPLSLSTSLSLLLAGARNNSQLQLKDVLKLSPEINDSVVDTYYKGLVEGYNNHFKNCQVNEEESASSSTQDEIPTNEDGSLDFKKLIKREEEKERRQRNMSDLVLITNKVLVSEYFSLLSQYAETLRDKYQSEISEEDFANDGEEIMKKVNQFVKESTKGLIASLLNEPPKRETVLMIINCLYFEGKWMFEFSPGMDEPFYVNEKEKKSAQLMRVDKNFKYLEVPYGSDENIKMAELKYMRNMSMIVILPPKSKSVDQLVTDKSLSELLTQFISHGQSEKLEIFMPKFSFKYTSSMNDNLKKLGAKDIFDRSSADLTGIAHSVERLYVSEVTHCTAIDVDEKGTRAAAVTVCTFELTCYVKPKKLRLDRPFIFVIYDLDLKLPLFLGKLQDPSNDL